MLRNDFMLRNTRLSSTTWFSENYQVTYESEFQSGVWDLTISPLYKKLTVKNIPDSRKDYYENRFQGKMFNEATILQDLNPILREEIVRILKYRLCSTSHLHYNNEEIAKNKFFESEKKVNQESLLNLKGKVPLKHKKNALFYMPWYFGSCGL